MKRNIFFVVLICVVSVNAAFAEFDKTNLDNLGKHFADCSPYRSPEYPNGKHGIASQQILGFVGDKCHYQEYGYYGPDRKKITHNCLFSKDDLKILGTLNSKNHISIMLPYLNDPYSCKVEDVE